MVNRDMNRETVLEAVKTFLRSKPLGDVREAAEALKVDIDELVEKLPSPIDRGELG